MEDMTSTHVRDLGLRRLSGITAWAGVGAVALTGVFAGVAAHATHPAATTTPPATTAAVAGNTGGGLTAAAPPVASVAPSHVRSGSS